VVSLNSVKETEMTFAVKRIEAICFDFGNTLIEFGPKQISHQFDALKNSLEIHFGYCDPDLLKAIRDRQIVAPFSNGLQENDLRTICYELIVEIYNVQPTDSQVDALMQTRFDAFVEIVRLPDGVRSLLDSLGQRYRLGFLSNYPCSRSILAGLEKIGLSERFESVTISGDVGYVKPHSKPFEVMLSNLGLAPDRCVYVGDNWLADVQGSKRIGMYSVHTTQFAPYEEFAPSVDDFSPDAQIGDIRELENLFLCE